MTYFSYAGGYVPDPDKAREIAHEMGGRGWRLHSIVVVDRYGIYAMFEYPRGQEDGQASFEQALQTTRRKK